MIRIIRALVVLAGLFLAVPALSLADYQAGVDAYHRGDFAGAYEAWLPLAEAGDAVAQNSIGALFDHGLGVEENNSEAARWYEMAANQNFVLGMRNLANLYAAGHGVTFDLELARSWYQKAADLGDSQAASLLAHLGPSATAAAAPATPSFAPPPAPATLAETQIPAPAVAEPAPAPSAELSAAVEEAPSLTIPADNSVPSVSDPAPAPADTTPIALDVGSNTLTLPGETAAVPSAPAPAASTPAATPPTQQAALQSSMPQERNWLIGQWQGPSLGCPPGGGVEFTPTETLNWFNGQVAVALKAGYSANGENINVTAIGADGVPQQYIYQRSSTDRMIIVAIPDTMPKSLLGVGYRRCAGTGSGQAVAMAPSANPAPGNPAPENSAPATADEAAPETPASAATASPDSLDAGWSAFSQGQFEKALDIWRKIAETGNSDVQVLVGTMYDYGQGVQQDDIQALQWYLMAAGSGNAKGQFHAGLLYYRSQTVPRDLVESYRWLQTAANTLKKSPETDVTGVTGTQIRMMLGEIAKLMSPADIEKASALADSFTGS